MAGTQGQRQFFTLLDQLRAVAALLVVFEHLVGNFLDYWHRVWVPNDVVQYYVDGPLQAEHFGWTGVVAFFFISGFVVTSAATVEGGREFAIKRLLRIYPPLIIAVAIVMVMSRFGILVVQLTEPPTIQQGLFAMTLGNWLVWDEPTKIAAVSWTLVIELIFYLLLLALRPVLLRWPTYVPVIILTVIVGVATVQPYTVGSLRLLINSAEFVPLLLLGQIVFLVRSGRATLQWGVGAVAVTALAQVYCLDPSHSGLAPGGPEFVTAAIVFLVFVLLVLAEGSLKPSRLLAVIARRSYVLYLMHVPVGYTVLDGIVRNTTLPYTLGLVIALVATAAATEITHRLVEKPAMRLASRLGRRFRRTPTFP